MSRGKEYNHYQKLELNPPEKKKEMKNVEHNENSPVEIIDERLKRLHTNVIDARNRLRLREEKGWEGGKNKGNLEGETTNILKRKHRLKSLRKESKDFTRVGWILDYRLRLRDEKGWAGGKKKTTED